MNYARQGGFIFFRLGVGWVGFSLLYLMDEIKFCHRRHTETKYSFPAKVGDSKISLGNDVHSDQDIKPIENSLGHSNASNHYMIWQKKINEICANTFFTGGIMRDRPPGGRKAKFFYNLFCYYRASRSRIPKPFIVSDFRWGFTGQFFRLKWL